MLLRYWSLTSMVPLIEHKRDGLELTSAEIHQFVTGVADGSLPDYQIAAMLMAIYLRGMSRRETVDLTQAMAESGDTLNWHDVADFVVDNSGSPEELAAEVDRVWRSLRA